MADGDHENIDARLVFEAAGQGDRIALSIVEKTSQYLAQSILNIATLFIPDIIVLSGGVMRNIDFFPPHLQQTMQSHTAMVPAQEIRIMPAQLGYYAGLYGSAYTIFKRPL
jgi:glucokinase